MEVFPDEILLMIVKHGTIDDDPLGEVDPRFFTRPNHKEFSPFLLAFSQVCRRFRRIVGAVDVVVYPSAWYLNRTEKDKYAYILMSTLNRIGSIWRFHAVVTGGIGENAVADNVNTLCKGIRKTGCPVVSLAFMLDRHIRRPPVIFQETIRNIKKNTTGTSVRAVRVHSNMKKNIYWWNTFLIDI